MEKMSRRNFIKGSVGAAAADRFIYSKLKSERTSEEEYEGFIFKEK